MKTLIIAEKPSVGRDIARVLKCAKKGDGYLYGEKYVISWAIGHLVTLFEPEDYEPSLKKWRSGDLPILPQTMCLKPMPKTAAQLRLLKKMMNSKEIADIICATDSGREGELIFRYIYKWAGCKKSVKRLWISSLTDSAISQGLEKMKQSSEYDNLYASARCRAEADWLVGMNATRAYTLSHDELLPMGRVQTPTLAMLVNRHMEITAFTAKDYYEVKAQFLLENGEAYSGIWLNKENEANDERTYNKEQAQAIAQKTNGRLGTIESIETEEKRQLPPQLFDLTELQRECNRRLGFSAKKTLEIAQSLYEKHKLITYPRTDSRYLSDDIAPKLPKVIEAVGVNEYKEFADYLLGLPKLPTSARIINTAKVSDHHAIIPTGGASPRSSDFSMVGMSSRSLDSPQAYKSPRSSLSADEARVYDRIIRNFLAVFYPANVYDVTTAITRVEDEAFRSKGRVEKNAGFTVIYSHEKATKTDEERLPALTKDEAVTVKNAEVLEKKTQPPKPYTEATLLSAMENAGRLIDDEALKEALKSSGLGTPATRAAIIEKIIASGYVQREKKNLIPTEKGIRLISIVPPEMRQPETTGKWERALAKIANGEMDEARFMESIRRYVCYLVEQAIVV
ncbi:MAG: DNA topoisomerase III [Defluviitaleaceae bacterium]|nr:DNA topoisomerase III [Defluviitaleaceae bacterium]